MNSKFKGKPKRGAKQNRLDGAQAVLKDSLALDLYAIWRHITINHNRARSHQECYKQSGFSALWELNFWALSAGYHNDSRRILRTLMGP